MTEHRRGFVVGFRCWIAEEWNCGTILLPASGRYKRHWLIDRPTKAACTRIHLPAMSAVDASVAWESDLSASHITVSCGDVSRSSTVRLTGPRFISREDEVAAIRAHLIARVRRESAKKNRTPVPARSCTCGLHAYSHLRSAVRHEDNHRFLVGAVLGWGRIVPYHSEGWRAQVAQPIALMRPSQPSYSRNRQAQSAAETYGIPLIAREALEPYALEFGERLPEAQR